MKNPNRCVGAGLLGRPLLLLVSALCVWSSLRLHSGQWGDFSYERLGDAIAITAYKGSQRSVTIPETIEGLPVTTLITSEWWGGELVTHVYLPASLTWLRSTFPFRWSKLLQSIEVARDNPIFSSRDGILFNKELTRLMRCPIAWPREQFIIPDTVTHIEAGAFGGCLTLTRVLATRRDHRSDVTRICQWRSWPPRG